MEGKRITTNASKPQSAATAFCPWPYRRDPVCDAQAERSSRKSHGRRRVWVTGIEPAWTCSQSKRAAITPHPVGTPLNKRASINSAHYGNMNIRMHIVGWQITHGVEDLNPARSVLEANLCPKHPPQVCGHRPGLRVVVWSLDGTLTTTCPRHWSHPGASSTSGRRATGHWPARYRRCRRSSWSRGCTTKVGGVNPYF